MFATLDESVHGSVKFGDGSLVVSRARGVKGDRGKRLGFGGGRGYVGRERRRMAATAPAGAVGGIGARVRTEGASKRRRAEGGM